MSRAAPITDGVQVGGHHVRVRVGGEGDPLLLLNGTTRPLESWDAFTEALPGRRLISLDVPGVGLSPTPVLPLTVPVLARLAVGVLDRADAPGPVDVLGFSFGGVVAQQLAVQSPSRLRRLVLVATSCGVGATPGTRDALSTLGRPAGAPWPLPDPVGTLWHLLAISSWSSIPFLGAVRAPTLVVTGTRDRVVPPSNSRVLARRIPDAQLVELPGVGHDVQRRPAVGHLATAVQRFLADPAPPAHRPQPQRREKVGTQ